MSLKRQSLETIVKGKNLGEIIKQCESSFVFEDICGSSKKFWKKVIDKLLGNILALQRLDLKSDNDWYLYAKGLNEGISFEYAVLWDVAEENPEAEDLAKPLYSFDRVEFHSTDIYPISAPILGILPVRNSIGFFVEVEFFHGRSIKDFSLIGSFEDIEDLKKVAKRYFVELAYIELRRQTDKGTIPLVTLNIGNTDFDLEQEVENLPVLDFFIEEVDKISFNDESVNYLTILSTLEDPNQFMEYTFILRRVSF